MARTINEIYDALAYEKSEQTDLSALVPDLDTAQALLTDLDTTSRVARWRLMLWIVSVAIWAHEKLWDLFRAEMEVLAAGSYIGTLPWYVAKAKVFQFGHALVIVDNVPRYAVDDAAARIVQSAAGRDVTGHVIIKVAKDAGGVLGPLDSTELAAFNAYMTAIKMAGTLLSVISAPPDLVRLTATVYYDPLLIAADGSLLSNPARFPAEEAINDYFSTLPFNGELSITALQDAIQLRKKEGIVNPIVNTLLTQYAAFPFTPVVQYYTTFSGYLRIDPLAPLATNITYVPYVG